MTVLHPSRPCLTSGPAAGRVIAVLFALTIALFVLGLVAL